MKLGIEITNGTTKVTLDLPDTAQIEYIQPAGARAAPPTHGDQKDGPAPAAPPVQNPESKKAMKEKAPGKCPYSSTKQIPLYGRWKYLEKRLGRPPTKEEMEHHQRKKGKPAKPKEESVTSHKPGRLKKAAVDPDKPLTIEERYDNYVKSMNGEKPLCDECLKMIRKAADAKYSGGLFFHQKCWNKN